jgi:hypothetical protein
VLVIYKQHAIKRVKSLGSPDVEAMEILDDSFFRMLIHATVNGPRLCVLNCLWQDDWIAAERRKFLKIPRSERALSEFLSKFMEILAVNGVQLTKVGQ